MKYLMLRTSKTKLYGKKHLQETRQFQSISYQEYMTLFSFIARKEIQRLIYNMKIILKITSIIIFNMKMEEENLEDKYLEQEVPSP